MVPSQTFFVVVFQQNVIVMILKNDVIGQEAIQRIGRKKWGQI